MHPHNKNSAVLLLLGAMLSGNCVSAEPNSSTPDARFSAIAPILVQLKLDRPLASTERLQIQMFDPAAQAVRSAQTQQWIALHPQVSVAEQTRALVEAERFVTQEVGAEHFAQSISWFETQPDQLYQMRYRLLKRDTDVASATDGGSWSPMQTARTPPAPLSAPNAPANLQPTAIAPFQITLSWKDRSANEYGFVVRACENSVCQDVARTLPNFNEITINVLPDRAYNLAVHAYNAAGESRASNAVRVRTKPAQAPTGAPMTSTVGGPADLIDQNCTSRKALLTPVENVPRLRRTREQIRLPEGRFADVFEAVDQLNCPRSGCAWMAYGRAGGCYRFLGEYKEIIGRDVRGMPLFFSSYSANASTGGSILIQSSPRGAVLVSKWRFGGYSTFLAKRGYDWFAPTKLGSDHWWRGF